MFDNCPTHSVAVLLPCYNEEVTIGNVVRDFRAALPGATIYVYDNNSTDHTAEIARNAGAVVRREPRQGKGNVILCILPLYALLSSLLPAPESLRPCSPQMLLLKSVSAFHIFLPHLLSVLQCRQPVFL